MLIIPVCYVGNQDVMDVGYIFECFKKKVHFKVNVYFSCLLKVISQYSTSHSLFMCMFTSKRFRIE